MRYAYYPGCSAESTARDMHQSTVAVARALGMDLVEPKGWTCCGATAGHQTDGLLAVALAVGLLAALLPAWRASRVSIAEALRKVG